MLSIESLNKLKPQLEHLYGYNPFKISTGILEPYDFQKNLWNSFNENKKVCVSQCRQVGMSTLLLNYVFQRSKDESQKILFVTPKDKEAKWKNKLLKDFYNLEKEIYGFSNANLENINFISPYKLQGLDPTLLVLDNATFYNFPFIAFCQEPDTIVNSCPRYKEDDFYQTYNDKNWVSKRIEFEDAPSETTKEELLKMMGQETFDMEILGHFKERPLAKNEDQKTISFRLPKYYLKLMEENMASLEFNQTDYFKFLIENYNCSKSKN